MSSLYLLIPIALLFVVIAIRILFWAINSGQYDNLDTEAHRILFDSDKPSGPADAPVSNSVCDSNNATHAAVKQDIATHANHASSEHDND